MVQPNDPIRSFEPLWGDWYADEFLGADGVARAYRLVRRDGGRAVYGACRHIAIPRDEAEAQSLRAKGLDAKAAAAYFEQRVARVRAAIERMNALRNESGVVTYEDHAVVHREGTLQWDILIRTEPLIPLGDYIADNPMEPEEVRRLGVELSRAFEACEAKGIVCRAFGEGDVYLSPQGAFKLGDLCVAGELMDDRTDFRGAPFSMAPEVYGGKPADAAASVYSLGILMYKLLNNNRYPFLPPAPQEISAQAAERALDLRMRGNMPPWPTGGDKALTSVVMKAIGFDPATRFASASEMKAALLARSAVELPEPLPARDATSPPAYAVGEKPLQGFTQSEYAPQPPAGYAYAPAQAHPPYAQSAPGYAQKPAARKKLGVGAIVGIVLGAAVIVTLLAILLVNSIKANKYEQALQLEASGSYKEALSAFSEIADYQESANHIDTLHVKLVDRYLSEGDAESARASLDAVSYEAPTEDQKTELLYNRIRVDFALKSYDAAFTGLTSLYAAPRGTELYEQAISDFCAVWITDRLNVDETVALKNQFSSNRMALKIIDNGAYKKATALLEGGNTAEAKTIFDALGSYADSSDMATECVYRDAQSTFDAGKYEEARTLFLGISAYKDALDKANVSLYRLACEQFTQNDYENAMANFAALARISFVPDDNFIYDNAPAIYDIARYYYQTADYTAAQGAFTLLSDIGYEQSGGYCTLCSLHIIGVSESDVDYLIPLIGLEDAGTMLLSSFDVAFAFLEGKWSCSSGYLEFERGTGLTFSLSAPNFGDVWDISNGVLFFYNSDNPGVTKNAYQFTIVSENEMTCYAYNNGKTYTLKRK